MATRDGAIARVTRFFDGDGFRDRLAELVAIPSTSQDPGHEADVQRYLDDGDPPVAGADGLHRRHPSQPARRLRPDPDRRAPRGPGAADHPDLRPRRHGARPGGPVARRPRSLAAHRGRRSLVRPRHRRQQGPARAEPVRARGGAGRTRRQARLQPEAGAGDLRGTRLHRPARLRRRAQGRAGRRCADRQRRAARDARGADHRHRHPRHLPLRSGGRSARRAACIPATGAG